MFNLKRQQIAVTMCRKRYRRERSPAHESVDTARVASSGLKTQCRMLLPIGVLVRREPIRRCEDNQEGFSFATTSEPRQNGFVAVVPERCP